LTREDMRLARQVSSDPRICGAEDVDETPFVCRRDAALAPLTLHGVSDRQAVERKRRRRGWVMRLAHADDVGDPYRPMKWAAADEQDIASNRVVRRQQRCEKRDE